MLLQISLKIWKACAISLQESVTYSGPQSGTGDTFLETYRTSFSAFKAYLNHKRVQIYFKHNFSWSGDRNASYMDFFWPGLGPFNEVEHNYQSWPTQCNPCSILKVSCKETLGQIVAQMYEGFAVDADLSKIQIFPKIYQKFCKQYWS